MHHPSESCDAVVSSMRRSREPKASHTRRSTGAALRAARGAVLQPSLLRSLSRPSETEHIPAWAARVRERLGVVEAQLRRLEREKQSLLGQLLGAPSALVDAALAPLQSPKGRSPVRREHAASSAAAPASMVRPKLWDAAGGDSTARLRLAAQSEGERVHPALAANASAEDSLECLIDVAEQVASPVCGNTRSGGSERADSNRERIIASASPARSRHNPLPHEALDSEEVAAGADVAPTAADDAPTAADDSALVESLSSESPARPPERLNFSPAACASRSSFSSPSRSPPAAVIPSSPAIMHAGVSPWGSPPRSASPDNQRSPRNALGDDASRAEGLEIAGESGFEVASALLGDVPRTPPNQEASEDGATRLARLLGRVPDAAQQPTAAERESRSPSVAPTISVSSEDEGTQAEPKHQDAGRSCDRNCTDDSPARPHEANDASGDSLQALAAMSPLRPRAASVGLRERIEQRQSSGSADSDAPLAEALVPSTSRLEVQQTSASSGLRPGRICPGELSDEALKKWMSFFGMKAVSSRSFMVKRLLEIDAYLNGAEAGDGEHEVCAERLEGTSHCRGRGRGRGRGRPKGKRPLDAAAGEGAAPAGPHVKAARAAPSDAVAAPAQHASLPVSPVSGGRSAEGEVESLPKLTGRAARAAEKSEAIEQLLTDVIRRDKDLWERMLLFDTIEIGELRERLASLEPELRGLSEQRLRKFLDAQQIVFANGWQGRENVHHGNFRF
mmetsp:Transcript_99477/g.176530  ORF Transcript_99477/g.176530 Transcript_99477/m.176530 type:complete len:737 (-) Transcript_99477:100-2310(-)